MRIKYIFSFTEPCSSSLCLSLLLLSLNVFTPPCLKLTQGKSEVMIDPILN